MQQSRTHVTLTTRENTSRMPALALPFSQICPSALLFAFLLQLRLPEPAAFSQVVLHNYRCTQALFQSPANTREHWSRRQTLTHSATTCILIVVARARPPLPSQSGSSGYAQTALWTKNGGGHAWTTAVRRLDRYVESASCNFSDKADRSIGLPGGYRLFVLLERVLSRGL
jgi:hypothetical protein